MKKITLCVITLSFAAFLALSAFADAAMPEYSFEQLVVTNPNGAVLYRFGYTLNEVGIVPYREELTRIFAFEDDVEEFDGQYYYTVDYEGKRCCVLTSDVIAADKFVEEPAENSMPKSAEPAELFEPLPLQAAEHPRFPDHPQDNAAFPTLPVFTLLGLIIVLQLAGIVLLIILLAKQKRQ